MSRGGVFLGARPLAPGEPAAAVIAGLPFDGTCSFRPGSRFAPAAVRDVSAGLESFSLARERDLEDLDFGDAGDLELPFGNPAAALAAVGRLADRLFDTCAFPLFIGGEHLVSLPLIAAARRRHPDLAVLQFDAHADLRDEYLGERLSHATVMRRAAEIVGPENLCQFGIRSGAREELEYGRRHTRWHPFSLAAVPAVLSELGDRPLYLSVDLDVLDPGCFPGTGTPEPGGVSVVDLLAALAHLADRRVVGADLVELSPPCDPAGFSPLVAAKIARELLLVSPTFTAS
ncbi:MAG: agmatinase [Deltaproteobacteria bacterium]|nr:agmatinase [Candidatus Anaeroferrophillacea bacterium]